jgi:CubicO group peptidase (beta-lactamase class C family)
MFKTKFLSSLLAFALLFSITLPTFAQIGNAQGSAATASASRYAAAVGAIEEKTEARRKELGIPGMSLAIVKDDQVIYARGLGFKDFENKVPATADTQFAIGSSTKAFTALTVLMTADEGKVSLDASPKTVLPYFKMADPDTDKNMTIRDLMTHSSGLNRTDLAMITGKLTRAELIRVAGEAKPVAKLHEKFGYQNLMFATAGEIVAVAQKKPWEEFVPERIFRPLGMNNSTMSMREMAKVKDRSLGYNYNFDTKETQKLPYRDIDQVAPAGAINSSANDMAKWVRFILNGGVVDGKRLISEKSFAEWLKPQMKVNPAGTVNYGLGWFIQKWNGLTVVQHGGNIDGFNALVAMIPEKKLGFVMLTNVSASSLGNELMPIVWENILGKPEAPKGDANAVVLPEKEAGMYKFQEAGFDLDIKWADGKLTAHVPNQPVYTLENVGGRRYKLNGAPDGFFITFMDKELYLEQPQGNYTLPRVGVETKPADLAAARELIGKYESEINGRPVEVKDADGKVTLNIPGQQPYALTEKSKDKFGLTPLPDTYWLTIVRGGDGKIAKFTVTQPEGEFGFKPAGESKIAMTVDELYAKALEAVGGEANWKKLSSRVTTATVDLEQQGVKATATSWAKAPNKTATESKMTAIGKEIATGWEFFDGTGGEEAYSFAPADKYTGKRLEDVRLASDFYSMLDWKSKYKTITISRIAKVGDEEACAVEFEPEKGTKFTDFYSTKTFLLLKREGIVPSSTSNISIPYSVKFEDYRDVDGVKLPFRQINNSAGNGDIVTVVTSVKHNVPVDDNLFAPRKIQ